MTETGLIGLIRRTSVHYVNKRSTNGQGSVTETSDAPPQQQPTAAATTTERGEAEYARPIATVDVSLFTLNANALAVTLVRRDKPPYQGILALPGVFVRPDEDGSLEEAAARALRVKIGMTPPHLEQLCTVGGPARDPRGWSVAIAYLAVAPSAAITPAAGVSLQLAAVDSLPDLPFDHARLIGMGVARLRNQASYSSLPAFLLPETFTLGELHQVYEQVLGTPLNKPAFRRKILDVGMIEEVPGGRRGGSHRPAQLYRLRRHALSRYDRVFRPARPLGGPTAG